ncbi:hypothetical protein KKE60_04165 [Patescibacteria group bacterium]|nr:hypothetical protein [Patescibacteria group bacterium]
MAQATLNGTILDDGGLPCEARFQYGTTPGMGTFTAWFGGFRTGDTFSRTVTGLLGNTNYYFRVEVRNAVGTGTGGILTFITTTGTSIRASVAILPPTEVTEHQATLQGLVEQQGTRAGNVRFHYGTTRGYGNLTGYQGGFGTGDSFSATILGLRPGTAYHCQAEFQSGTPVFSGDLTFSTLAELGGVTLVDDELLRLLEVI